MTDSHDKTENSEETATEPTNAVAISSASTATMGDDTILNRIIKRFGGRHLIFRTQLGKWHLLPHSYGLVSTFRGPIWLFYGAGQVWLTHKKYHQYDGWQARIPRIWSPKITLLLDKLQPQITEFTHHCNEQGIEGTLVIEPTILEFHWTFGYPLKQEKQKKEHTNMLDSQFQQLVDSFLAAKKELNL